MTAVDPDDLDAEVRERIAAQVDATVARHEARRQQRADQAARRTAGLQQRHTRKLARQEPPSVPRVARTPVRIREEVAVPSQDGRPANPQDVPTEAPARRSGRQCGYEHRDQLISATRALGAALTRLARDADPDARQAGADLAREVAEYVRAAVFRADESSGRARRAAADVERQLPRITRQLDQLRTRLHPDVTGRNGDHAVATPPVTSGNAPRSG